MFKKSLLSLRVTVTTEYLLFSQMNNTYFVTCNISLRQRNLDRVNQKLDTT